MSKKTTVWEITLLRTPTGNIATPKDASFKLIRFITYFNMFMKQNIKYRLPGTYRLKEKSYFGIPFKVTITKIQ